MQIRTPKEKISISKFFVFGNCPRNHWFPSWNDFVNIDKRFLYIDIASHLKKNHKIILKIIIDFCHKYLFYIIILFNYKRKRKKNILGIIIKPKEIYFITNII